MKITAKILPMIIMAALAIFSVSCKTKDPGKSDTDIQIEKLVGNWKVQSVTQDGTAPTLVYTNMILKIQGSTGSKQVSYTVEGRPNPSPWPSGGTLAFGANVKQNLTRDDEASLNYTVTATSLIVDFNYNGTPYPSTGRVANVTGNWHFEFVKQ